MSTLLLDLSNKPSAAILDGLRGLERKTSLVFTLLKASVYSIVLNQQMDDHNQDGRNGEREDDEGEGDRSEM
jgi:DASH complex subunit DAD3